VSILVSYFLISAVIQGGVEQVGAILFGGKHHAKDGVPGFLVFMAVDFIQTPLLMGFTQVGLDMVINQNLDMKRMFMYYFGDLEFVVKVFGATLAVRALTMLGFVLFIIPGLYAIAVFAVVVPVMLDDPGLSIPDAMKKSWELMGPSWLQALLVVLVQILSCVLCFLILPIYWFGPLIVLLIPALWISASSSPVQP